ncbi:MAG TPA: hypothetical protein VNE58_02570 [Casimicrobiaceae bacterium]|nr:hypothetical protein [Casimicrobiaceae bacterium]
MRDPASALTERVANRLLEDEAWAREKLRAHASESFLVTCGPIATLFGVTADGTLESLSLRDKVPSVTIRISPFDVPAFLAHPERWPELTSTAGDAKLGETLRELAVTLPWFVERGLANAFGPVIGQRLADTGRALLTFPETATRKLVDNVTSYARDEAPMLARGDEARKFAAENDDIAKRVESLSDRIDRL